MKSGFTDSHTIKKYLLGNLAGTAEHEDIEKRLMLDGPFHSEIELAEIELIEEYLDRALNVSEIKDFEANFLAAPERKAKFRFMLALKEKASEHVQEKNRAVVTDMPHPPMPRRGVFLNDWLSLPAFAALGVIVIVGIGLLSYFSVNRADGKINEGLAALNTAYPNHRPTEARLSVFDYAPHPVTRGGPQSEADSQALEQAGLLFLTAVRETPGAESYRALGLYYASKQEPEKALKQFDQGLLYKPSDGQFYADYGAVLLEMAKTGKVSADARLRFLENSLSQLDKALKLNNDSLPALFNKALCLQELNSSGAARDAWQKYLEKDASSPWAKEAREKLKALDEKDNGARSETQVLDDFMKAYEQENKVRAWKIAAESKEMITGTMISDQLTRGLLSADAQGAPEDADRMLSALNFLGQLEKNNSGDLFFSDLAEFYARANRDQRLKLQKAQLLTLEGYKLCKNAQYIEALEKFKQSRELFAEARNLQEAAKTDYWISYCRAENDLNESIRLAGSVADYSRGRSYKWLLSQALTQSSSSYSRLSKFSLAIKDAREALSIARDISDVYNRQKAAVQLADTYTQLNEPSGALENSQNSLRENGTYFNSPRQIWRNYMFAAQVSYRFKLGESAVAYAQEAVKLSRETLRDPAAISNSFFLLSAAYKANQHLDDALNAAEESVKVSSTFKPGPTRTRLLSDALLQKAEVERPLADCPAALKNYDQANSLFIELGGQETVKNYYALKGKLLCHNELGDDQKVEEGLRAVLTLAEKLRGTIEEEESKTSFFAGEQSIYELAAAHALKKGNTELAFEYIENGKGRSLLDDLRRQGPSSPSDPVNVLSLNDIRQRLPAGSQVVQYSILPDKLLIWVVNDSGVKLAEKNIPAADLEAKVRDIMQSASSASADPTRTNDQAAELYSLLIQPVQSFLDKNKEVVIVPDKILCYLPFEILRSPAGRYNVQDYQLSYSTSATLFVVLSREAAKRAAVKGEEEFLGIGNPAFDRAENPTLENLSAAENEIRSSAALYPMHNLQLIGPEAEKQAIIAALPRSDVFHFAGHSKANNVSPRLSTLLLAGKDPAGNNDLTGAEISKLKLNRTRLVILSACKTAIENYYHGEGAIGIARTFFAAGAPTVVASRWEVDSAASAKLMTAFHRYRKDKKLSTSAALRAAQLDMLQSEDNSSPYFWAAFAVVGGMDKM